MRGGEPGIMIVDDFIICDACGDRFISTLDENDDPVPLLEEAEESTWIIDEENTYCPEHIGYHPDNSEQFEFQQEKWGQQLGCEW